MTAINEIHGRDAGIAVSRSACLLREAVREYDVVARLGATSSPCCFRTPTPGVRHTCWRASAGWSLMPTAAGVCPGVSLGSAPPPTETPAQQSASLRRVSLQCDQERREV